MKRISVFSLLFIFFVSTVLAGTVNLPKTGQTKCYDTAGTEISCAGTGQDGDIQAGVAWPEPRFTVSGNYVTDNLTGLMWAKNGNIMPTRDPDWDTDFVRNDGMVTWQHALDYVAKLNADGYLGYSDWRLPNVNELESLVNGAEANTATWLNTQGFTNAQGNSYWSSTTVADDTGGAWSVSMYYGNVTQNFKFYYGYVWPVRAGESTTEPAQIWKTGQTTSYYAKDDGELKKGVAWPTPRFTDHGNETVTDNLTGLMWTKNANLSGSTRTWQQVLDYVKGMNAGTYQNFGHTDWRLPNRKELHSLTDFSRYNPALPSGQPFTNVQVYHYYWSSTTYAYATGCAWRVSMYLGNVDYFYGKSEDVNYIWPVRNGQIQIPKCLSWEDVIQKYQDYVSGEINWGDVIACYQEYSS